MSPLLLRTFNHYLGGDYSAAEAAEYVRNLRVFPLPERATLDDWRVHVPMPLLESWSTLSDQERIAVFVMAHSATHPYECVSGPEEPAMN